MVNSFSQIYIQIMIILRNKRVSFVNEPCFAGWFLEQHHHQMPINESQQEQQQRFSLCPRLIAGIKYSPAGNGTFMDLPCARRNKSRIKSGVLLIGTEYLNTVGRIGNLLVKILPSLLPFSKWFGLWVKQQVANRVRQRRVYFKWVRV